MIGWSHCIQGDGHPTLGSGSLHQDLLAPRPEESMLFHSHSGVLSPTVFLGILPFGTREVGLRRLANLMGTSRATRNPETRTARSKVNTSFWSYPYRDITTGKLDAWRSNNPNAEMPIVRKHATWDPLYPGTPRCHVNLGISWIADSRLQISCPWKPRIPRFRYSGFTPPVHARINGLDPVEKSPFAI